MASNFWGLLKKYKVVIPIIQRDYAQGRNIGKIPSIRKNILNAIFTTIATDHQILQLDFIYGYTKPTDSDNLFYPLDGQQRLTTLFLLHWYIAVREGHHDLAKDVLLNFTYETRHSSEVFCQKLVKYKPENSNIPISKNIKNQPWFFTAWNNDPTVSSMLVMLDSIQEKANEFEIKNVWDRLISVDSSITFHLLDMDELGLPDELYIKMNSRGKELTDFEYFKGRISEIIPSSYSDDFNHKIDLQWTDLFWDLYTNDKDKSSDIAKKLDAGFLRFFRYITDIIIHKYKVQGIDGLDEIDVFKHIYSEEEHVKFLFEILNVFSKHKEEVPDFYEKLFYTESSSFVPEKTRLYFDKKNINLFKKCADSYDAKQRNNPFSLGEQLLFYGCIVHLLNSTSDFNYRIRKLRNLIINSEDTVRNENIFSLLTSVEDIIIHNKLDSDSKFSNTQIKEEEAKEKFLINNPEMISTIRKIEDHKLLRGCISIFELSTELIDYIPIFEKVFTDKNEYDVINYDLISRALLTQGSYMQTLGWRKFLGNDSDMTWRQLFTPSLRRSGFTNTKSILKQLLDVLKEDPEMKIQHIVDNYLEEFATNSNKDKDWKYYFIKYNAFRKHEDGYYYWPDELKPYESIMLRRTTLGGFHWDPFLLALSWRKIDCLTLDNYNAPLIYSNGDATIKIYTLNNCYQLEALDELGERLLQMAARVGIISSSYKLIINQSKKHLDTEDRVQKSIEMIDKLNELKLTSY